MKPERLIIIGLDGIPFPLLKDLTQTGIMPNTGRIIQDGFLTPMRSSIPEISSVAWSSIITGTNPGEHGIFGFTDMHPSSYKIRFPNFNDLKSPPFWNQCRGKSVIINVPSTYPVGEMNGVHISGFVSIDFEKSIHPKSLVPQLKKLDYRLDVDAQKAHSSMDLFLADLDKSLDARIRAFRYLWENQDWQTFMLAFTGTDRLMHFLWSAYDDKNHKYHNAFLGHLRKIDEVIGQINESISENYALILLSDHGFEGLDKDIYINRFLIQQGLLTLAQGSEPNWANIEYATKAFALDPARIYINLKGKYPKGSVSHDQKSSLINKLQELFYSFEIDGRKVINQVHRKEDIYSGPYLEDAPDLVLISEKGFNLKSAMTAQELTGKGPFTGKHTYQDAFLLIRNKSIVPDFDNQPSVIDAGKLIKSLVTKDVM